MGLRDGSRAVSDHTLQLHLNLDLWVRLVLQYELIILLVKLVTSNNTIFEAVLPAHIFALIQADLIVIGKSLSYKQETLSRSGVVQSRAVFRSRKFTCLFLVCLKECKGARTQCTCLIFLFQFHQDIYFSEGQSHGVTFAQLWCCQQGARGLPDRSHLLEHDARPIQCENRKPRFTPSSLFNLECF